MDRGLWYSLDADTDNYQAVMIVCATGSIIVAIIVITIFAVCKMKKQETETFAPYMVSLKPISVSYI